MPTARPIMVARIGAVSRAARPVVPCWSNRYPAIGAAAAWALGRIAAADLESDAAAMLGRRMEIETDDDVRAEITAAIPQRPFSRGR